jgi:hypothetical protein
MPANRRDDNRRDDDRHDDNRCGAAYWRQPLRRSILELPDLVLTPAQRGGPSDDAVQVAINSQSAVSRLSGSK